VLALAIATSLGVGYAPIAPGTFGSAAGLVLWAVLPGSIAVQSASIVLLFIAADVIVRNVFRIRAAGGGLAELETVTKSYSSGAVR